MNKNQQRNQHAEQWNSAVNSAVLEQKRQLKWMKLQRVFKSGVAGLTKWGLLAALLAGVAAGGFYLWQNNGRLATCREHIVTAVNPSLTRNGFDAISAVEFTDASIILPTPTTLAFEQSLVRTDGKWAERTFMVKGNFDRAAGTVEITAPYRAKMTVESLH